MTTIKAYTDLEQSKTLAKILPLESADMYYEEVCNLPKAIVGNYILHIQCMEDKDYKKLSKPVLSPAWSLASLLDVLPEIQGGKPIIALDDNYITYPHMSDLHTKADNLVDACYDMIIKLNELNLL